MSNPLYVDISGWNQPLTIAQWEAYKAWSALGDGRSRVAIKINEGTAGIDATCHDHWNKALEVGIDSIILYHYARPDLNAGWQGAQAEVTSFLAQLGSGLRPSDFLMLDYEQAPELADWCFDFLHLLEEDSKVSRQRISVYANLATISASLCKDPALAEYNLILADWTGNAAEIPPAPSPWVSIFALQYTDRLSVPGFSEPVDADVFLHAPGVTLPTPPAAPDLAKIKADLAVALSALSDAQKLLSGF